MYWSYRFFHARLKNLYTACQLLPFEMSTFQNFPYTILVMKTFQSDSCQIGHWAMKWDMALFSCRLHKEIFTLHSWFIIVINKFGCGHDGSQYGYNVVCEHTPVTNVKVKRKREMSKTIMSSYRIWFTHHLDCYFHFHFWGIIWIIFALFTQDTQILMVHGVCALLTSNFLYCRPLILGDSQFLNRALLIKILMYFTSNSNLNF